MHGLVAPRDQWAQILTSHQVILARFDGNISFQYFGSRMSMICHSGDVVLDLALHIVLAVYSRFCQYVLRFLIMGTQSLTVHQDAMMLPIASGMFVSALKLLLGDMSSHTTLNGAE